MSESTEILIWLRYITFALIGIMFSLILYVNARVRDKQK